MWYQTWFKTTLTIKLTAAATTLTAATAPTVTNWRLLLRKWNLNEWISFSWVSWTTLTWLTRWLSQTADPATWWTWLEWPAWTQIILVAMHDQLMDKQEEWDLSFQINNLEDWITLTTTNLDTLLEWWKYICIWALNTNTPKTGEFTLDIYKDNIAWTKQIATYFDSSIYTRYYVSSVWSSWIPSFWVLSSSIASGTTTNLATATWDTIHITWTTTITWFWTVNAWAKFNLIFDWILTLTYNATSLILPTNTNITTAVWDTCILVSEWSWNWRVINYQRRDWSALIATDFYPEYLELKNLTSWENLVNNNFLRYWFGWSWWNITQWTWWFGSYYINYNSTSYWVWQWITISNWWKIDNILYDLKKVWSPTWWNLLAKIRTSTSSVDSSNVLATSSIIACNTISSSYTQYTFSFDDFYLLPWTYYITIESDTLSLSSSNYIQCDASSSSLYAWWIVYEIASSWGWSGDASKDLKFQVTISESLDTKVYIARWTTEQANNVIWIANWTVASWNTFNAISYWRKTWFSSLTPWEVYYLKDDWTIWTTPWTVSTKIGRAISSTEILFIPQL